MPPRFDDWPAHLAAFIEARRRRAFSWGDNDCAIFAGDWVLACTGADTLLAGLRGRWSTKTGAGRVLRRVGGLEAETTRRMGDPISWAYAGRGDLALLTMPDGPALFVVAGEQCCAPGDDGLKFQPVSAATAAWRVGAPTSEPKAPSRTAEA